MRKSRNQGFTLVEILIVVVILGILAAIVVPQFTNASQEALKSSLRTQLQTINSQIELFRVQNAGQLPHQVTGVNFLAGDADGDPNWNGWGILVQQNFLKSPPSNGYVQSRVVNGGSTGAPAAAQGSGNPGWIYDNVGTDVNSFLGNVFAAGFNEQTGLLAHEVTP